MMVSDLIICERKSVPSDIPVQAAAVCYIVIFAKANIENWSSVFKFAK